MSKSSRTFGFIVEVFQIFVVTMRMSDDLLSLHLATSSKIWLCIFVVGFSLSTLVILLPLHLMFIGLLVCLLAYVKLPTPNPERVREILEDLSYTRNAEVGSVVAHRAACLDAPENSLEAVREAAKNGAKWVEFDVSFTSDGVAVAFHDDTVDRVTSGSGLISSLSLAQVAGLDLASKHPKSSDFKNARIPTVEQFVDECLKNDMKLIIDLKTYTMPDETIDLLSKLYIKHPELKRNSIVTSFFPNLLYRLRSRHPDAVAAISTRPYFLSCSSWEGTRASMRPRFPSLARQLLAGAGDAVFSALLDSLLWWVVGLSAVLVHRHVITREYVDTWRARGVTVMAWTVNCPVEKKFYRDVLKVPVLSDTMDHRQS